MGRSSSGNVGTITTNNTTIEYTENNYSATFTGPFDDSQVVTVVTRKIGKHITLEIPSVSASPNLTPVTSAVAVGVLPSGMRPASAVHHVIPIVSNALLLTTPGKLTIATNGNLTIYVNFLETGLFSILGNNGWQRTCVDYTIA